MDNDPGAIFTHKTGVKRYIRKSEIAKYGIAPEQFEQKLKEQAPSTQYPGLTQQDISEKSLGISSSLALERGKQLLDEQKKSTLEEQLRNDIYNSVNPNETISPDYVKDLMTTAPYVSFLKEKGVNISSPKSKDELDREDKQKEALDMVRRTYDVANELKGRDTSEITGGIKSYITIPGSPAVRTASLYDQLKAMLSVESRQKLKGQGTISDYEAKMLEKASTELKREMSNEDFQAVLGKIVKVYESKLPKDELPKNEVPSNYNMSTASGPVNAPPITPTSLPTITPTPAKQSVEELPSISNNPLSMVSEVNEFTKGLPDMVKTGFPITQLPERIESLTLPETRDYLGKAIGGQLSVQKKPTDMGDQLAMGIAGPIGLGMKRPDIFGETIGPAIETVFTTETMKGIKNMLSPLNNKQWGELRRQAAEKYPLDQNSINDFVANVDDYVTRVNPQAAPKWKIERESILKSKDINTIIDKFNVWSQAFKDSGELKDTVNAKLYGQLKMEANSMLDKLSGGELTQLTKSMSDVFKKEANAKERAKYVRYILQSLAPAAALWLVGQGMIGVMKTTGNTNQ